MDLSVSIGPLRLKNPFLTASGTFGYGTEFDGVVDLSRIGGVVTKSLTLCPREGNPPPRICETPAGMLNSIGLENCGLETFVARKLPALAALPTRVIVSVAGESADEYAAVVERLAGEEAVDGFEINVSCPNVKAGTSFGSDPRLAGPLIARLRRASRKPMIVKLTPSAPDIIDVARACAAEGADGAVICNTFPGMVIDVRTRAPAVANVAGGISGPAIRPLAVRLVYLAHRALPGFPIVGSGGICSIEDAAQFFIAGASAVQIGTANFFDPNLLNRLASDLEKYLTGQGLSDFRSLIGNMRLPA
ncbi:MAG: dihydroorotate dehydrogenase [Planctomycetota bacterium]|nr:dihydroorotate dehydrogenase [Planctomycetota bacterium]